MAETTPLTPKQQRIYDFICQRIEERGYPPTIRDIGTGFDIRSPNGVMCHLKALEKKGFIVRDGKSARAIRPTTPQGRRPGLPFKGLVAAGVADPGGGPGRTDRPARPVFRDRTHLSSRSAANR